MPGNAFDDARGNAFPAVLLDEGEQVCTEWFKGDAYMGRGGDGVDERVEKGDDIGPAGVRRGGIGYLAKKFYFIPSGL